MSSRPRKKADRVPPDGDPRSTTGPRARPSGGPSVRVSAFIQRAGSVLLVKQRRNGSTYWLLPGGGLERGEPLEAAVAREVWEECALRAEVAGPPLALVQTISPDGGATRHLLQLVFPARMLDDEAPAPEPEVPAPTTDPAIHEVRWFDRASVASLDIHPPIAHLIAAWLHPDTGVEATPPRPCLVTEPLWAPERRGER